MHASKRDHRFQGRFLVRTLLLLAPALAALAFILRRSWAEPGQVPWPAVGFFLAWIALWAFAEKTMLRRYRCPACGLPIEAPTIRDRNAGDPIRFACDRCGIEWDTGLREAGD